MVLIKGMEMPKDCIVCPFGWNGCNKQHDFVYMGSRPDNCPLVPVPPHGDLIERNALFKKCEFVCTDDDEDIRAVRYSIIENTPTIIPAEKGE